MGKKKTLSFTFITMIIGLMLAVQFRSVQTPEVRDTRDTWQLREDLNEEMELKARLIKEIRANEQKLAEYETERKQGQEQALKNTLNELKEQAGLTDVTGPGVTIQISKLDDELLLDHVDYTLSPDLLRRLLNELNMYGAKNVSIGGQRVINTTVIREIAGETKINGRSLKNFPLEIRVITETFEDAQELYNRMLVSKAAEEFFIDNLKVNVLDPEMSVTVPAYEDSIRIRNIESVKADKGES
ncbi:DUF881 domain-containing protein [Robertmurraya kyonggiensis]|uniref:DUF881 domain-containing protein n=1 Tax=Robertmurraya kyonggiensis TaxID=1037680 RepID=A0A4U1D7L0_9BACI|nr:DUF881 domain-containing protein [Robertmurraya kyonggiensis]TKC18579.1 DUF881 domain-containing protein [Robertmurraya kyonggiensis]